MMSILLAFIGLIVWIFLASLVIKTTVEFTIYVNEWWGFPLYMSLVFPLCCIALVGVFFVPLTIFNLTN